MRAVPHWRQDLGDGEEMSVFRAEYKKLIQVGTRSTYQIVLEVPEEQTDDALAILGGVPKSGKQVWVAVARLTPESDGDRESGSAPVPPGPEKPSSAPNQKGPAPSDDAPVVITRFFDGTAVPVPGTRVPTDGERIRTRAVMLCKDPAFFEWLNAERPMKRIESHMSREDWTQMVLKERLGIGSRSILAHDPEAQKRFLLLEAQYKAEKSA